MKHKGYLVKHYFGPACGEYVSLYWFERRNPRTDWANLGIKEGIVIYIKGDAFGFSGMMKPHEVKYLY